MAFKCAASGISTRRAHRAAANDGLGPGVPHGLLGGLDEVPSGLAVFLRPVPSPTTLRRSDVRGRKQTPAGWKTSGDLNVLEGQASTLRLRPVGARQRTQKAASNAHGERVAKNRKQKQIDPSGSFISGEYLLLGEAMKTVLLQKHKASCLIRALLENEVSSGLTKNGRIGRQGHIMLSV